MKNKSLLSVLFLAIIFLNSCGGTIGNIEKYNFNNVSQDSLKAAVAKVYSKHPELKKYDTTKYKDGKPESIPVRHYCTVNENNEIFLFIYAYPKYPPPYDTISEIALLTASKYGEDLPLASKIGFFNKRKYRKLFNKYFISLVKMELEGKKED